MMDNRDKKLWIFNAGTSFGGNPKWLFLYIEKYHREIECVWFCYENETYNTVKKLGYKACLYDSPKAQQIGSHAGVYVVEQCKEVFQDYLEGITVLNLWHGVGCKNIEIYVRDGFLQEGCVKKNIINKNVYVNNQLFLVTSQFMEDHFSTQMDLRPEQIVRGSYPKCLDGSNYVKTFDYEDIFNTDDEYMVYAPTYRDYEGASNFLKAFPDIPRLIEVLEKKNIRLIIKMHPKVEKEDSYLSAKNKYGNSSRLIFWDNQNDIYEVMDKISVAIIDYSSIFYDFLAKGVKHFIRYFYDENDKHAMRDFAFDYHDYTTGKICNDYDALLNAICEGDYEDDSDKQLEIQKQFWEYSDTNTNELLIETVKQFEIRDENLPILYSFDVFDTLIGRKCFSPEGIFYYIQDKLNSTQLEYDSYIKNNFVKIRKWAESTAREYYRKSHLFRDSILDEITFDCIYERIQEVYGLTDKQINQLKEWELEAELRASIPITERIEYLKELVNAGEKVILISDMYLPKDFVKKMLRKADEIFDKIPLYLSNETGKMKSNKQLYFEVFHSIGYEYSKWIHYGDNEKADGRAPQSIGIESIIHELVPFNQYENKLCKEFYASYDGHLVSNLFRNQRQKEKTCEEIYGYSYVSLYMVPYVNWAIKHALQRGIECLYFISRDGFHLKRIADKIIEVKNYKMETKYIYGSRKAWRIPSIIENVDEDFFSDYGNFAGCQSLDDIIAASGLETEEFLNIFPELDTFKNEEVIDSKKLNQITSLLSSSEKYKQELLKIADEKRKIVEDYIIQEIDLSQKYAFVEFWGRGYTQTCLANIINHIAGKEVESIFYYARSIYPSHGKIIRYNFTYNNWSYIFIESIFANLPYKSVKGYQYDNEKIVPIIQENENNMALHDALYNELPQFAEDYSKLDLLDENLTDRMLFDFALSYFHRNGKKDTIFSTVFATLKDSVSTYGTEREWAPPITIKAIFEFALGKRFVTKNMTMSVQRSKKVYRILYRIYERILKKYIKR